MLDELHCVRIVFNTGKDRCASSGSDRAFHNTYLGRTSFAELSTLTRMLILGTEVPRL
jgi:hypothetical protein